MFFSFPGKSERCDLISAASRHGVSRSPLAIARVPKLYVGTFSFREQSATRILHEDVTRPRDAVGHLKLLKVIRIFVF